MTLTQVIGTAARSRLESTRRNYAADWQRFTTWCAREGHVVLLAHPLTVAAYLLAVAATVTEAGAKPAVRPRWPAGLPASATITAAPAIPSPAATSSWPPPCPGSAATTPRGERPRSPRAPLLTADIVTIIEKMRANTGSWAVEVLERRDAAILLLGFAGTFWRSELVALPFRDNSLHRLDGLHIKLRKSKTDQEGRGSVRAHLAADQPDIATDTLVRLRELMNRAVPDCRVTGYEALIRALTLPDEDGQHVLASAISCGAQVSVTANLRDFPDAEHT